MPLLLSRADADDAELVAVDREGVAALADRCSGALSGPKTRVAAVRTDDVGLAAMLAALLGLCHLPRSFPGGLVTPLGSLLPLRLEELHINRVARQRIAYLGARSS